MNEQLLETIDELINVIYKLQDGGKEWDEYSAIVDRAYQTEREVERQLWWQRLEAS